MEKLIIVGIHEHNSQSFVIRCICMTRSFIQRGKVGYLITNKAIILQNIVPKKEILLTHIE